MGALTFNINRNAINIPTPLQFAMFGVLDFKTDYINVITGNPATIGRNRDGKSLNFVYGGDTITISCNEVPYINLVNGYGFILKIKQLKLVVSDVTQQSFFSTAVNTSHKSIYGLNESDSFTPNSFKSDMQNQNDIRTVNINSPIDMENSLLFQYPAQIMSIQLIAHY